MLRIGLLGAGRIGKVHASAISAHMKSELCSVSDAYPKSAQNLAEEFNAKVQSSEEIIEDPSIDAVLIATPTDTHSDLIEAATAAGKHETNVPQRKNSGSEKQVEGLMNQIKTLSFHHREVHKYLFLVQRGDGSGKA